jgi:polysaccharide biosynthesis protein PslH
MKAGGWADGTRCVPAGGASRLRILDVAPRLVWPPDNGSTARMYHQLSALSKRHHIRQFSQPQLHQLRARDHQPEAQPTPNYVEFRNPSLIAATAAELCNRTWIRPQAIFSGAALRLAPPPRLRAWIRWANVVLVEFPWQFAYCRRAARGVPVVLASHNIEILTRRSNALAAGIRARGSVLLRCVERIEQQAVSGADLILAVSDADRRVYTERFRIAPDRVVTIPNGTDTEALTPLPPSERPTLRAHLRLPERPTVAFLAAGPKIPDLEGLKWVRRVAHRLPDHTFLIIGGVCAHPFVDGNVVATGHVADHRPYLQAADMSLSPIEHGGGTKIKVFDGLAAGLPSIVFTETIHGTELQDGEHVVRADKSEAALVQAIVRILDEPTVAADLAAAGRRFVCAHHDWTRIADRLESVLVDVVRGQRGWRGQGAPS